MSGGRPSKYNEKFHPQLAFWLGQAGLKDTAIADELGIAESTLNKWKIDHPAFSESLNKGKATPDDEVEAALLKRAKGFDYLDGSKERHALPDTTAMIFWLKNRRPDRWRDKQHFEHTGEGGGPLVIERTSKGVE